MSNPSKTLSDSATPDREDDAGECSKDSPVAICPSRPISQATTSQTEDGNQVHLSDLLKAQVSDSRPAVTLPSPLDLHALPPKPGERAIERAPSSAADVVDTNSHLSAAQLKYRLRFCQEKIDCCRDMLEFIVDTVDGVSQTQEIYNAYVVPLLGTTTLHHNDIASKPCAQKSLEILDRMEALEDVNLRDLMFVHDVHERITDYTHENLDDEHNAECQYHNL